MTTDQVQTIIKEAAKNLPGHLALILTTECEVSINDDGYLDVEWMGEITDDKADAIMNALQEAAEHYQPPLHPYQIN
jgi:hypothetical protein